MIPESRKPWWLLPNLLSLDAPLVAVSWLYVFAKTWRVGYIPWQGALALGLSVWAIYAADRLLDVSLRGADAPGFGERHRFHYRYRHGFRIGIGAALLASLVLVITEMPLVIYAYLAVAGMMVLGFFALSFFAPDDGRQIPYAKNVLAGLTFAYGTTLVTHAYQPASAVGELPQSREFVCFALLCILNISAIDLWEHADRTADLYGKAADELALALPLILLVVASLFFAVFDPEMTTRSFYYAIMTGAALMYVLNRNRARFSICALRVLADVALLVPVLVFLAFHR